MLKKTQQGYLQEVHTGYNVRTAAEEAARCLLCHDEPCSSDCPAGTSPGKFIRSLRFRNVKGAAETIRENNILGGCCARVCPTSRLCEKACSRTGIDKPIDIRGLQRFIVEQEQRFDMQVLQPQPGSSEAVALIGAGPASLACAAELVKCGIAADVYEQRPRAGGMLSYGIPPARLPQAVVDFDVEQAIAAGVRIFTNKKVGQDISCADLQRDYKAVFIGSGMWNGRAAGVPGEQLEGVWSALDFLGVARDRGEEIVAGKDVIVVGGGDTAMDCAATAKLLNAANVTIVYRRTHAEAPADYEELEYIHSLGIPMMTRFKPTEIRGDKSGERFVASGTDGISDIYLKADIVIFAIGQAGEQFAEFEGIEYAANDKIVVDTAWHTGCTGVFAAGDAVSGGATVVQAVAEGKLAAQSIMEFLKLGGR